MNRMRQDGAEDAPLAGSVVLPNRRVPAEVTFSGVTPGTSSQPPGPRPAGSLGDYAIVHQANS